MAIRNKTTDKTRRFRILSVSDDDGLRRSRDLLLAHEGFEMESVTSDAALVVSLLRSFTAALVCQSVDPDRAVALCERLHRINPEIQIVCIAAPDYPRVNNADLEIPSGPKALLEGFHALCAKFGPAGKGVQTYQDH